MTSHHLTVAKATFAASLLRPDVTRISRDEAAQFHALFESAVKHCSASNIQTCKTWLLQHIVPSSHRTTAFMKYAIAFAKHATPIETGASKISTQRQSLHILYVLHDLLHHINYHAPDAELGTSISQAMGSMAVDLFRSAAWDQKARVCSRLRSVVTIWETERLLPQEHLTQIRDAITDPSSSDKMERASGNGQVDPGAQEVPYIMPATHGDPGLPFHELPAGNLMPHIIPNRSIAMRPENIRPLQFRSGPADESLVNVVKDFLKEVDAIGNTYEYLDDEGIVPDIDDLGQLTYRNEEGEIVGDTYYGWSRAFCDKMKERRRIPLDKAAKGRSRSYSSSRSRSPHKRRRLSNSSQGTPPYASQTRRLRSRSTTPPAFHTQQRNNVSTSTNHNLATTNSFAPPRYLPPALPIPPLGPNGLPLPPPRPPNWDGPWPPPPPPPPPLSGHPPSYGQR